MKGNNNIKEAQSIYALYAIYFFHRRNKNVKILFNALELLGELMKVPEGHFVCNNLARH